MNNKRSSEGQIFSTNHSHRAKNNNNNNRNCSDITQHSPTALHFVSPAGIHRFIRQNGKKWLIRKIFRD
jgi:hypothetical protein